MSRNASLVSACVLFALLSLACGGVKPGVSLSPETTSPIVGEWEFRAPDGEKAVYTFDKDGTLAIRLKDGSRAHGKYKLLNKDRVDLEYSFGVLSEGATFKLVFRDKDHIIAKSEATGNEYKLDRTKR